MIRGVSTAGRILDVANVAIFVCVVVPVVLTVTVGVLAVKAVNAAAGWVRRC